MKNSKVCKKGDINNTFFCGMPICWPIFPRKSEKSNKMVFHRLLLHYSKYFKKLLKVDGVTKNIFIHSLLSFSEFTSNLKIFDPDVLKPLIVLFQMGHE